MSYNAWIAINKAMKSTINQDPLAAQIRSHTDLNIFKFFNEQNGGAKTWQLFSVYADDVQSGKEIEDLEALYPTDFIIMGAWHWETGIQVGMRIDISGSLTGVPRYPMSATKGGKTISEWLAGFTPSGLLEDVHLMYGQAPRDFNLY